MKIGFMPVRNSNALCLNQNAFLSDKVTASFFPLSVYMEFYTLFQLLKPDTEQKPM